MKYSVGMTVTCVDYPEWGSGEIVDFHATTKLPLVQFERYIDKHDGFGEGITQKRFKYGHCYYICESELAPVVCKKTIIFTTDGRTTTARLKGDGPVDKVAKAVCNPSDTFDQYTGAKLALDRLFGKEVKEDKPAENHTYKAGDLVKVIANHNLHCFTIGDIVTLYGEKDGFGSWRCTSAENPKTFGNWVREYDMEPYTPTVREVKRPAKVGEWVKLIACNNCCNSFSLNQKVGEILLVDGKKIRPDSVGYLYGVGAAWERGDYVVLEGYQPEKQEELEEEKPKYWSGKVICVDDSNTMCFTKGKVYEFRDGFVYQDGGKKYDIRPAFDLANAEKLYGCHVKFIEYKGEANA